MRFGLVFETPSDGTFFGVEYELGPNLELDTASLSDVDDDPAGAEQDLLGVVDVKAVHGSLALEPWKVGFEVCQ